MLRYVEFFSITVACLIIKWGVLWSKGNTDEFKIAAVKRIQQGESLNSVSKKIGVATSTLTPWVEKFKNAARVSAVVDSVVVVPNKKTIKKKRSYKLFSIEEKTSAIRMAMEGTSHDKICKHLGMSRPSLTNWIKEHLLVHRKEL